MKINPGQPEPMQAPPTRGPQHAALEVFVGVWTAEGKSFGGPHQDPQNPRANPARWASTHNAQWHAGEFFLIQDERALVDGPFDTLSIMGWDENAARYFARTFDNLGFYRHYHLTADGKVWTISGETERASITFSDDGKQQVISWEWRPQGQWIALCDRVAKKL